ncbi:5'-methylthioadenosine/S-adenosylhomocysteine nucleosidase [Chelativorans sp. J32]|uniref:5'-methylthioadenosine/S-adenosylhomocysteine nucleosidase n=1 Tax=Chelativorans sp. J32 TaxID=935840 RepID=UPI0004BBAFED|nr:5'-methylthioadenosine/S-adenosylhomocysteine nucleosidase [Chelativorans sp. J32]
MKARGFSILLSAIRFLCVTLGLLAIFTPAQAAELLDGKSRIAIVSAFAPEWVSLQDELTERQEYEINGNTYLTGKLAGRDVVMYLSGVSMVNAAMTTQSALDRFVVTAVIFSGIAGGVDPALHIGDVVIAGQWGQYLEAIFARETEDGFTIPPFFKQEFPGFGMIVPKSVTLHRKGSGEEEARFWFPVDEDLLEIAGTVASKLELEDCVEANKCLSKRPRIVVGGNGVSGPVFVDNAAFREYVMKTFQARVLDMESAAVAHVAYSNGVPFLAVRSLSDLAGGGEGTNEMSTFMALAATNSAAVVKALLAEIP